MDVLDKFFKKYSYKFPKGYPDLKDKQDILLLESILENEFGIVLEFLYKKKYQPSDEKDEIIDIISKSNLNKGLAGVNKNILKFFDIPTATTDNSLNIRNSLLDDLKDLFQNTDYEVEIFQSLKKDKTPQITFSKEGNKIETFLVKGAGGVWVKETTQKEGLVIFFYNSSVKNLFTLDSLKKDFPTLFNNRKDYYRGLESTKSDVDRYLSVFNDNLENIDKEALKAINDPLSSAIRIKGGYGNDNAMITGKGTFDNVRKEGSQLSGLPEDKWNPGDVYIQLEDGKYNSSKTIVQFNLNFTSEWGITKNAENEDASFVSISLKEEKSAAGKGKSYLEQFTETFDDIIYKGDDYNLTKEEKDFLNKATNEEIKDKIEEIQSMIGSNYTDDRIKYDLDSPPTKTDQLKTKYAAVKALKFLVINVANDTKTSNFYDAISSISSYAASLNGKNCSFFKVSGNPTGIAKMDPYPAETTGKITGPIKIEDKSSAGGIDISFTLKVIDPKGNDVSEARKKLTIRSGSPRNPNVAIELKNG